MKVTIDLDDAVHDELKLLAAEENKSVETVVEALLLQRLRIFILGKLSGMKKGHAATMDILDKIGQ